MTSKAAAQDKLNHPWNRFPKTKPVSARVAMKRQAAPGPSRLSPRIRAILERTRRARAELDARLEDR